MNLSVCSSGQTLEYQLKEGSQPMIRTPKLIQSLSRAFHILDVFTEDQQVLKLNEIANEVNLNINTTRGLVQTLVYYGYLAHNKVNNTYRLGNIFLEKADLANFDLSQRVIDLIESDCIGLANSNNISIRLIAIENLDVSTVHVAYPQYTRYQINIRDNVDFPLYASATGKLLLASLTENNLSRVVDNLSWHPYAKNTILEVDQLLDQLDQIRQQGYSLERDELMDGISSIAVPVKNEDGELMFSLSGLATSVVFDKAIDDTRRHLQAIAAHIEAEVF